MTDKIWKTDCANCVHACSQTVRIGDCAYGNSVEECGCDVEDRLKDNDTPLIDEGRCPLWCPDIEVLTDNMADAFCFRGEDKILALVCEFLGIDIAEVRKEATRRLEIMRIEEKEWNADE